MSCVFQIVCIINVMLAVCPGYYGLTSYIFIQVVPGRAGGGSFRRKKKYIAKKEFAYRMFARRPTIFFGVNEAFAVAWL